MKPSQRTVFGTRFMTLILAALCATDPCPGIITLYVNQGYACPTGRCGNGYYSSLQAALQDAEFGSAFDTVEVWVSAGVYRPDFGTGSRSASFRMRNGVAIIGGFDGSFTAWSPDYYVTILSGEINNPLSQLDNSFHVVDASHTLLPGGGTRPALLIGCTLEGGMANGASPRDRVGGGLLAVDGQPYLERCWFRWNHALEGGGAIYCENGDPWIYGCALESNFVTSGYGGGLCMVGGASLVEFTIFILNSAAEPTGTATSDSVGYGGAVHNEGGKAEFRGCRFYGNLAFHGGGAISHRAGASPMVLRDCILAGNHAIYVGGGGIFTKDGTVELKNCTLSGNVANTGGEILAFTSELAAHNSIIWGNRALNRARVVPEVLQHIGFFAFDPDFTLRESGGHIVLFGTNLEVAYSNIQGGMESIYVDPLSSVDDAAGNLAPPADPVLTGAGTLQSSSPCIDRGDPASIGLSPSDVDGEPRVRNGRVDLGADEFTDSDGDGLPNAFERYVPGGTTPNADSDSDGLSNATEYIVGGLDPRIPPIHVNATTGSDAYDGWAPSFQGNGVGPKRTLQAAILAAPPGGSVLVAPGVYAGAGNTDLDLDFKNLAIRAPQGPSATRIDGGGIRAALRHDRMTFLPLWIEGFTFSHLTDVYGGALRLNNGRHAWLKDCRLEDARAAEQGGGFFALLADVTIDGLSLRNNTAPDGSCGVVYSSSLNLLGDLVIEDGEFLLYSAFIGTRPAAKRAVRLAEGTGLRIGSFTEGEPVPPSVIHADITGAGRIRIDAGQQLIIGGDAEVNLSDAPGTACATPHPNTPARIHVDGSLVVQDRARILNNHIDVSLLTLSSGADIRYNDISAPLDSAGFGGEFFVETDASGGDRVSVTCNRIQAVGDRYLDLDPDPSIPADQRPIIQGNHLEVVIVEGTGGPQGTILELRARDYHCDPAAAESCPTGTLHPGLIPWPDRSQFDSDLFPANNWVLESLTIRAHAKLNLTNRQGFDFNLDRPDTLYVKDLVLEAGAVLNLAGQRLYYNTIDLGAEAQVRDEPLLGFSLGIIGMNDDNEFSVRIRRRVTDPDADGRPEDPAAPPLPRGDIRRLTDGLIPGDGVMEMTTRAAGQATAATSVAAKGHFTRAGEDAILVLFLYLFQDPNPNAEILVKLSGHREVARENREIARIRPEPGRPGSFGSGRFGVFHLSVPRGDLNLTRGTFIELELRGGRPPDDSDSALPARVWIENWDPQITCNQAGFCGDLDNSFGGLVTERDYLLLVAACGQAIEPDDPLAPLPGYSLWCLDLSGDKYVDLADLLRWDAFLTTGLSLCATEPPTPLIGPALALYAPRIAGGLVVAGKERSLTGTPDDPVVQSKYLDRLYSLEPSAVSVDAAGMTHVTDVVCPHGGQSPAGGPQSIGNGRLIQDNLGRLFQIHQAGGIYLLSRAGTDGDVVVVPPSSALPYPGDPSRIIHIGLNTAVGPDEVGEPIADAAIRTVDGQTFVYVAPVVVVDQATQCSYKAAARLRLTEGPSPCIVERVYGKPSCLDAGAWSGVDRQQLREIELSRDGRRLYVASAMGFNANDAILVFDEAASEPVQVVALDSFSPVGSARAPVALFADTDALYLSSPIRPLSADGLPTGEAASPLMRLAILPDGRLCTTGSCGPKSLTIRNPCIGPTAPCVANPLPANPMVGYMTGISANNGWLWVSGYMTPTFRDDEVPAGTDLFTTATLALVHPDWFDAPPSSVAAARLDCGDLALPLSAVFLPSTAGDFDHDGDVDAEDVAALVACLAGPAVPLPAECGDKDLDADQDIDQADFGLLQRCFSGAGRPAGDECSK